MLECDQDVNSNKRFFLFSSRSIGQQATAIGLTIGQRCSSVTKLVTVMSVALIPMHAQKSLKMFKNTDNIWNKIFTSCNKTSAVKASKHCPGILWVSSQVRPALVLWLGLHPYGLHTGKSTLVPGTSLFRYLISASTVLECQMSLVIGYMIFWTGHIQISLVFESEYS